MTKRTAPVLFLLIFLTLFIHTVSSAEIITVTYDLSLKSVLPGVEDYFGENATATISYDLETTGEAMPSFPAITNYKDAIISYSFTSHNDSSNFDVYLVGSNSDIQIHNNSGSWDRFRSPYDYNGSINVPGYENATDVGIEIDQLYSLDTFDSMDLPSVYPTTLNGPWNYFFIHLSPATDEVTYNITNVASTITTPNCSDEYDAGKDFCINNPEECGLYSESYVTILTQQCNEALEILQNDIESKDSEISTLTVSIQQLQAEFDALEEECNAGSPSEPFICNLNIQIPFSAGQIDIRYGEQNLADGAQVQLENNSIQWRLNINNYNSAWKSFTVDETCTLAVSDSDYCDLLINIPDELGEDAQVDLRYGPQNLVNGNTVILPKGNTIQWRLSANGFNSSWKSFTVDDSCELTVTEVDYSNVIVDIPVPNGQIDIRYGAQDLNNGDVIILPRGNTIQWRVSLNGYNSAWKNFEVNEDSTLSITETDDYCEMTIGIPFESGDVDLRYGPQNLDGSVPVYLPMGNDIQWRLSVNGYNSAWYSVTIGESCELQLGSDHYSEMTLEITSGQVDLRYGPQDLINEDSVILPKGNTIQWRSDVDGIVSGWESINIDGDFILSVPIN